MPETAAALMTIYTKPSCAQCDGTLNYLDRQAAKARIDIRKHIELIDLTTDPAGLARVKELGHQQAPVVEFGERSWSGFDPLELKRAVKAIAAGLVPDPEPTAAAA